MVHVNHFENEPPKMTEEEKMNTIGQKRKGMMNTNEVTMVYLT
jgi:hypothetical protein